MNSDQSMMFGANTFYDQDLEENHRTKNQKLINKIERLYIIKKKENLNEKLLHLSIEKKTTNKDKKCK